MLIGLARCWNQATLKQNNAAMSREEPSENRQYSRFEEADAFLDGLKLVMDADLTVDSTEEQNTEEWDTNRRMLLIVR